MCGFEEKKEELDFHQLMVCPFCGSYSRWNVFMTYTVVSLFFIPVFKWNRRYFCVAGCCEAIYELPKETGEAIRKGDDCKIREEELKPIKEGRRKRKHVCTCGYETEEDFVYCPNCGKQF